MLKLKTKHLKTDNGKKAVIIDFETYKKIEDALENFGLWKYIQEAEKDETLTLKEAKAHYKTVSRSVPVSRF